MAEFEQVGGLANRFYQGLAERIFPDGAEIQCLTCQIVRRCNTEEIAQWTHHGYPKCKKCGKKTELVNIYVK